jgi:hypothetical protein
LKARHLTELATLPYILPAYLIGLSYESCTYALNHLPQHSLASTRPLHNLVTQAKSNVPSFAFGTIGIAFNPTTVDSTFKATPAIFINCDDTNNFLRVYVPHQQILILVRSFKPISPLTIPEAWNLQRNPTYIDAGIPTSANSSSDLTPLDTFAASSHQLSIQSTAVTSIPILRPDVPTSKNDLDALQNTFDQSYSANIPNVNNSFSPKVILDASTTHLPPSFLSISKSVSNISVNANRSIPYRQRIKVPTAVSKPHFRSASCPRRCDQEGDGVLNLMITSPSPIKCLSLFSNLDLNNKPSNSDFHSLEQLRLAFVDSFIFPKRAHVIYIWDPGKIICSLWSV